jgi:SAM-dependent methyltransferase
MIPAQTSRVIDLGCGNGTFLRRLARLRPDCEFVGIEYAPLPWLWSGLTCARLGNCRIIRGDFWSRPLSDYDLVYAFLSPVPMARLWAKAGAEMKAGSLLVSNTFVVPGQEADVVIQVDDRRGTVLHCYRVAPPPPAGSR